MFYCDECAKKNGWPVVFMARSYGPCEICGNKTDCNDVKSSRLPPGAEPKKLDPTRCMHFIGHLTVRTRGQRKNDDDRSPPPRVEVECTACGWKGWYELEKTKKE